MGVTSDNKDDCFDKARKKFVNKSNIPSHHKTFLNKCYALIEIHLNEGVNFEDEQKRFYADTRSSCKMAMQSIITNDGAQYDYMIFNAAMYLINFESLKGMETFLENYIDINDCDKIVLYCCDLVTLKRRKILESVLPQPSNCFFETKQEILEKFIHKQLTYVEESILPESKKQSFLYECAVNLENVDLQKRINHLRSKISDSNGSQSVISDIETDGRIYDRVRDPPGQRCFYIPPGDPRKQTYRLSSFIKFPPETPVNPRDLAEVGFYYTGYTDRVKCFSCGLCAEDWALGDDVTSSRWHLPDCKMMKGEECGNIRIGGGFTGGGFARPTGPLSSTSSSSFGQLHMEGPMVTNAFSGCESNAFGQQDNRIATPAGQLLMNGSNPSEMSITQTASSITPLPTANTSLQNIQVATITSVHHEQLIRSLDLRKEIDRLKTFARCSHDDFVISPNDFARSGFFYLGNLDRVQCFSCGGVLRNWKIGDNVAAEHVKHFPQCRMALHADNRNVSAGIAVPAQQQAAAPESVMSNMSVQGAGQMRYQCLYPVSPHMREVDARIESFDYRWPFRQVRATPREIAEAGFFFLGERDRVKCWYCNGGLQNWDPQDIPWKEHAKWFPTCEFLLREKGPTFAQEMVLAFPNIRRPILRSPYDVTPNLSLGSIQSPLAQAPSPPPLLIDPQRERIRVEEELKEALNSCITQQAVEMGFDRSTIRQVIKNQLTKGGMMYTNITPFVDDLTQYSPGSDDEMSHETGNWLSPSGTSTELALPAEQIGSEASRLPESTSRSKGENATSKGNHQIANLPENTSRPENALPSMEERIRELQEERNCKICLDKSADVVFVPCGHLCCCVGCAGALRKCPICRVKIEKAIRTYLS